MGNANGPFETEGEALDAVRDGLAHGDTYPLLTAIEDAGVELGAYDRKIVGWLGQWPQQYHAVIAGIITRAYEAGAASAWASGQPPFTADDMRAIFARIPGPHEPHRIGDSPVCIVCGKEHGAGDPR